MNRIFRYACLMLVVSPFLLMGTEGLAKGKEGGPPGFGKGEKKGWTSETPPGWSHGEKKGWKEGAAK